MCIYIHTCIYIYMIYYVLYIIYTYYMNLYEIIIGRGVLYGLPMPQLWNAVNFLGSVFRVACPFHLIIFITGNEERPDTSKSNTVHQHLLYPFLVMVHFLLLLVKPKPQTGHDAWYILLWAPPVLIKLVILKVQLPKNPSESGIMFTNLATISIWKEPTFYLFFYPIDPVIPPNPSPSHPALSHRSPSGRGIALHR